MKTCNTVALCLALSVIGAGAQTANNTASQPGGPAGAAAVNVPAPTPFRIVEQGLNHRIWQRETYEQLPNGQVATHVHKVTEIAAGMYHVQNEQLVESKEEIVPYASGAIAQEGQYQVIFGNNLNSAGAIDLQTPDGKRLTSNILGLGYYDSSTGQSVLLASIQDSQGALLSPNQVIYPNAFSGVSADVIYIYKRGGFSQDVILKAQLPTPESFGLNSATTKLEVMTEFINPPSETVTVNKDRTGAEVDEEVAWGATRIGRGRAFDLSNKGVTAGVTVEKKYVNVEGRKILFELVPMKAVAASLSRLPLQASLETRHPLLAATEAGIIPGTPKPLVKPEPMKLAAATPAVTGYLLDYVTMDLSETNYTFQGDTTYYVSGTVNLAGTTTLEGGTVIKFDPTNSCVINVLAPWSARRAPTGRRCLPPPTMTRWVKVRRSAGEPPLEL
jgi:hypothetical protein